MTGSETTAPGARATGFDHVIETLDELVAVCGEPDGATRSKILDHLDRHCRAIIELSPFCLVGTADAAGRCDVSPRGGPSGFVEVIDARRLVFAEAKGNRLNDSLRNIHETGRIGLLFLIPGMNETLRVNGRACITRDPAILARHVVQEGRPPRVAVGVDVEQAYLHCAKAFIRSSLWKSESWPPLDGLARPAQIWKDHLQLPDLTVEAIEEMERNAYTNELY
jgi:PPOX class probable FMN-dependent enzyme